MAIVKKSEFEDYIIMEQCYPVKTMVKKKLLSFLGEELYDEKILAFYRGERRMSSLGSENNNWIICHYCHKLIHGQYIKCSNSKAK